MQEATSFELNLSYKTLMNKFNEKQMTVLLQSLFDNNDTFQFQVPVDWEKFGLFNYLEVVKKPMDLGTVRKNLKKGIYRHVEQCLEDIQLIWENSKLYNEGNQVKVFISQWIYKLTIKCENIFAKLVKNYFPSNIKDNKFHQKRKIVSQSELG